jgi:hypothetical protein
MCCNRKVRKRAMVRERGRCNKGEKERCTLGMHYNREEKERAMARERRGDLAEGRMCAPLGCIAIKRRQRVPMLGKK